MPSLSRPTAEGGRVGLKRWLGVATHLNHLGQYPLALRNIDNRTVCHSKLPKPDFLVLETLLLGNHSTMP